MTKAEKLKAYAEKLDALIFTECFGQSDYEDFCAGRSWKVIKTIADEIILREKESSDYSF